VLSLYFRAGDPAGGPRQAELFATFDDPDAGSRWNSIGTRGSGRTG
jgi:hypothetical protein